MLAQNFKTAADLGISDLWFEGLVKMLGMMERGEVRHVPTIDNYFDRRRGTPQKFYALFNMANIWTRTKGNCGTAGCIAGNCDVLFKTRFAPNGVLDDNIPENLMALFCPNIPEEQWGDITVEQSASALRSYLTTGEPRWAEALTQ